jgi:hypothetical protein
MAVEKGVDDYTQDRTVVLKGNLVRRSKHGRSMNRLLVGVYKRGEY